MAKRIIRIFVSAVFLAFLFPTCITGIVKAAREETLMGTVVKQGNGTWRIIQPSFDYHG
ncbi:MAG: hypothetical protein ABSG91_01295 [Syntrophobacteraceae bacterium]